MTGFVPYTSRDGYQLNNVPGPHLRRLWKRVHKERSSATNVIGQILAERYDLQFTPSPRGRGYADSGVKGWSSNAVSIRLPPQLMDAVRHEAEREQLTIRSVILNALSDAFKLKRPAQTHLAGKRPGRRKGT